MAKERVLVVDIDGTLCKIKGPEEDYATLACDQQMKARLIDLHDQGWRIILSSSRGMRTYDGNLGEILRHVLPVVTAWLDEHGVPYDEIWMGKPWPGRDGFYVDDRTVRPREFLNNSLEELAAICDRDRLL
ncbi:capsular biosynthesis protein [Croceibacterium mercuriale]|uniref:Capsular biosynthesis protein n=1 Tax=Croceibacterium mercuriale TaxID=1572751 RepID=A0A0B2BRX7_9SPHN|nr:capsular biosynthesis protein [Croceibacterium mercuriale]